MLSWVPSVMALSVIQLVDICCHVMPWYGVQGALLRDGLMGGGELLPYSAQSVMSVGEEDLLS